MNKYHDISNIINELKVFDIINKSSTILYIKEDYNNDMSNITVIKLDINEYYKKFDTLSDWIIKIQILKRIIILLIYIHMVII